jgi:hypothetical protein
MADGFDEVRADLTGVAAELGRISDLANGVSRSLSRAFRGAVLDGKSLNGVLAEIGRSFADIALKAAFKPVGDLIGGAVETLFQAANPVVLGGGASPAARGLEAAGKVSVAFNVTSPDARSFVASEAEVSAMLLRAVKRGTRGS